MQIPKPAWKATHLLTRAWFRLGRRCLNPKAGCLLFPLECIAWWAAFVMTLKLQALLSPFWWFLWCTTSSGLSCLPCRSCHSWRWYRTLLGLGHGSLRKKYPSLCLWWFTTCPPLSYNEGTNHSPTLPQNQSLHKIGRPCITTTLTPQSRQPP